MLSKHQFEKSFEKTPPTYHDCDQTIWKLGSRFNSLYMYPKTWRATLRTRMYPGNPTRYLIGGGIGHGHCQAEVGAVVW